MLLLQSHLTGAMFRYDMALLRSMLKNFSQVLWISISSNNARCVLRFGLHSTENFVTFLEYQVSFPSTVLLSFITLRDKN